MARIDIINGSVILPDMVLRKASIAIEGRKIKSIRRTGMAKGNVIDASGLFVSPGFIDTHIHGDPEKIIQNEIPVGTTSFVAAISCDPIKKICRKAKELMRLKSTHPMGANILGCRLEGPYISKIKAGAQERRYIKTAGMVRPEGLIKMLKPSLKIMTVAPEVRDSRRIITALARSGIIASAGHSDADFYETAAAVDAGVTHATHIFNAMSGIKDGRNGVAEELLADGRVWAETILDLVHVDKALFGILLKVKGVGRTILISDSVRAEKVKGVTRVGSAYRFKDGRLAGSAISMIDAVRNAVTRCGVGLPEAVRMASLNPARLLGIGRRKGSIEPGKDADLVIFDKNFRVKMVIIGGKIAMNKVKGQG